MVIVSGPGSGQRYPLGPRTTIGRDDKNTIELEDERSSRNHAVLMESNEGYWLQDLGSTNGTRVNGEPIQEPVRVEPGDKVQVGITVLQVVRSTQPVAPTETAQPMWCANCGRPIPSDANFCGACGHRVV
jgi:pSer/pThr/pTyr-binding forkhead associated (FHA) protein